MRRQLLKLLQDLKYTMKGLESQASEFDIVGFDPPVIGRRPVIPQTPGELAAVGYSNGVNKITFAATTAPDAFCIWSRPNRPIHRATPSSARTKIAAVRTHRRQARRAGTVSSLGARRPRTDVGTVERGGRLSRMTAAVF